MDPGSHTHGQLLASAAASSHPECRPVHGVCVCVGGVLDSHGPENALHLLSGLCEVDFNVFLSTANVKTFVGKLFFVCFR